MPEMLTMFSLRDRVVLITGSSQGIGRALADACAQAGAHVVINARSAGNVDAVVEELTDAGHTASGHVADVTDPVEAEDMVAASFINGQTLFVDGGMTSVV